MNIIIMNRELPYNISAFTHDNLDGSYTIIVNSLLCSERQKEAVLHEVAHIQGDDFYSEQSVALLETLMHKRELSLDILEDVDFFYVS